MRSYLTIGTAQNFNKFNVIPIRFVHFVNVSNLYKILFVSIRTLHSLIGEFIELIRI